MEQATSGVTSTAPHENIFQEIGHGIETVGKDIGHVVVESVEFPAKAEKVIATVVQDGTPIKAELLILINDGKSALADGIVAVSDKGLDWTQDAKTVADVVALAKYFASTFVPALEAAYNQLNTDVA